MNEELAKFYLEKENNIKSISEDQELQKLSLDWMVKADKYKYTYNFSWMGRPIIKFPADMVVQQEILWDLKPDLVIETGVAHGGSIIYTASLLKMMNIKGHVVGIDIDIRSHNKELITKHPMSESITLIEGDSNSKEVLQQVEKIAKNYNKVLVILDSLHTEEHVYNELLNYSKFVSSGSYLILPDTFIEFFPDGYFNDRPWDRGNNPYTAMKKFLAVNSDFIIDKDRSNKTPITESIEGYLLKK